MTQLSAFVGHSFAPDDHSVVESFLKYFNQIKGMDIGFNWESAEPAQPKDLADKVMNLIKDKNLFIGICTRKEAVIDAAHLSRNKFRRKLLSGPEDRFSSKTSDWIIQEIGLALGRGMDLILLVENGLRQPGGLQGNLEYIQFERTAPEKSFGKLLEMIQTLRPKAKSLFTPETEMTQAVEERRIEDDHKKDTEWLEPKQDWHAQDYDMAAFHMIITGNVEGEKRITDAFLGSNEAQLEANKQRWEARTEYFRLSFGKGGTLSKLEALADNYPNNSDVYLYLGRGYQKYTEYEKAGECFLAAAEKTADKKLILTRLGDALLAFVRTGPKERSQDLVKQMKLLARQVDGGEIMLMSTLRKAAEIQKEKQLLFGVAERLLQLQPDDADTRFSLAYDYSQANQNELSLFHYLKIPYDLRPSMAWNNLGVQFDLADLPGKSVEAYRKAEALGNTLAMSNLGQKFINAGFLPEASEICDKAITIKDYHQNVGHAIARIKAIPTEEQNKETAVLDKAKPVSEFYRAFGHATSQDDITDHVGRWQGPDCELQITIKGNVFIAEGNYEVSDSGQRLREALAGKPPFPPITEKYRVSYSGKIQGHAVDSTVTRKEITTPFASSTFLTDLVNSKRAIMIISDNLNEIRVGEQDSSDKFSFYLLTRLD